MNFSLARGYVLGLATACALLGAYHHAIMWCIGIFLCLVALVGFHIEETSR